MESDENAQTSAQVESREKRPTAAELQDMRRAQEIERERRRGPVLREYARLQEMSRAIAQAPVVRGFTIPRGLRGKERVKVLRQRVHAEVANLYEASRYF